MKLEIVDDTDLETPPAEKPLNLNQLATMFQLSRQTIGTRIRKAGVAPIKINGKGGQYYWLKDVQECLSEAAPHGKVAEKNDAQVRKLEAEADLKEHDLARKRNESILVVDVEQGMIELFRALHNVLNSYAAESALDIARITARGQVEAYQKDHFNAMLESLRDNPNNFVTKHLDTETS